MSPFLAGGRASRTARVRRCRLLFLATFLALIVPPAFAQPNPTGAKTGSLVVDVDGDGVIDPGDTIRFQIDIDNTGTADATGVSLQDILDGDVTFQNGSMKITPIAFDDAYVAVGNTRRTVNAAAGLLANDIDPDAPTPLTNGGLQVVPASVTHLSGIMGTINVATDGSFTYDPPVGQIGTEQFGYTITDQDGLQNVDQGIITITINELVWYVNNENGVDNPVGGNGTFADPFDSLAPLTTGGDPDAPGDTIFVYEGLLPYAGGIELEANQDFLGEGVTLVVDGITIVTGSAANRPVIANAGGDAIELASGNTVRGMDVGDTAGFGISGNTVGTTTINNIAITGIGGGVNIDGDLRQHNRVWRFGGYRFEQCYGHVHRYQRHHAQQQFRDRDYEFRDGDFLVWQPWRDHHRWRGA